jgi:hypothetical protein
MRIAEVRARVVEWRGKSVAPQRHFCTNPGYIDLSDEVPGLGLSIQEDALSRFEVIE